MKCKFVATRLRLFIFYESWSSGIFLTLSVLTLRIEPSRTKRIIQIPDTSLLLHLVPSRSLQSRFFSLVYDNNLVRGHTKTFYPAVPIGEHAAASFVNQDVL